MYRIVFVLAVMTATAHADVPTGYQCSPGTPKIRTGCVCPAGFVSSRDGQNTAICKFVRQARKANNEAPDVKACNAGNALMCEELSERYYEGSEGATRDPGKAFGFLEKACKLNSSRACNNLGTKWSEGKDGAPKVDHAKAAPLYQKACNSNNGLGCFNYANVFRIGEGVAVNLQFAFDHFKKSCELGEAKGCTEEAIMHFEGKPVKKDFDRAFALFERACELGSKVACKNLEILKSQKP